MSSRKKFSSLRKRPGGVVPQNRLSAPVQKISIPTENTIIGGKMFVVKPLSLDEKQRQREIKTCYFLGLDIREAGLEDSPSLVIDVNQADYNGTVITSGAHDPLQLCVCKNEEYIYFRKGNALIDKMVLPRQSMRSASFAEDFVGAVFVFPKNFGYISISFSPTGTSLYGFLRTHSEAWVQNIVEVCPIEKLQELREHELRRREISHKDPLTVVRPEEGTSSDESTANTTIPESDDLLRSGLSEITNHVNKRKTDRQTRSVSRQTGGYDQSIPLTIDAAFSAEREIPALEDSAKKDDVAQIISETPAPFEPPLRHALDSDKKFIISYNDFKTLYNNDWINDTLIDFFIAYEMDKAVKELRSVRKSDVFAFNSFFFTKLVSKSDYQDTPPYYENIRRWLAKLDLMSYNSVIIPINEHLHWYCAIIKNLPALLRHFQNVALSAENDTSEKPSSPPNVDIFVIDSLKQSHANLSAPLKDVIKKYCKDKHDVTISTESIRLRTARVSKQRNFNDCGIHVIYNIRKWLEDPVTCESIWKTHGKSKSKVFKGTERNMMRRMCIDLLLDLHSKQPADVSSAENGSAEDGPSDDEIELISYSERAKDSEKSANTSKVEPADSIIDAQLPATESITPKVDRFVSPEKTMKGSEEDSVPSKKGATIGSVVEPRAEKVTESKPETVKEPEPTSPTSTPESVKPNNYEEFFLRVNMKDTLTGPKQSIGATSPPFSKEPPRKTLDPRVIEKSEPKAMRFSKRIEDKGLPVQHPQIRRQLLGVRLNRHTIEFLNSVFTEHSRRLSDTKLESMVGWVKEYNQAEHLIQTSNIQELEHKIREFSKRAPVPMDEPFVIKDSDDSPPDTNQDPDDSNGELNKSVGELSISKHKHFRPEHESTPGATRHFMSQTETSYSSRDPRQTRIVGRFSDDHGSDLEIVDGDLELVSEVSLVLDSPRERKKDMTAEGQRKKGLPDTRMAISELDAKNSTPTAELFEIHSSPRDSNSFHVSSPGNSKYTKSVKNTKSQKSTSSPKGSPPVSKVSSVSYEPRKLRTQTSSSILSSPTPDEQDVFEVVNVYEDDDKKYSPGRKLSDRILSASKRRKVEDRLSRSRKVSGHSDG